MTPPPGLTPSEPRGYCTPMTRVVLLETRIAVEYQNHHAERFPFVLGWLRSQGVDASWWVVRVDERDVHAGGRFVPALTPPRRAALLDAVQRSRPDALISSYRLHPDLVADLRALVPHLAVVETDRLDLDALVRSGGAKVVPCAEPDPRGPAFEAVEAAPPTYDRVALGDADLRDDGIFLLPGTAFCSYRGRLADNRFYRDLTDPVVTGHVGCAFCGKLHEAPDRVRGDALERALAQVVAHQRALASGAPRTEYVLEDVAIAFRVDQWAEALDAAGVRPSVFVMMLRADELVRLRPRLEAALPRFVRSGHTFRVVSIGAENFSPAENERLNKGLTPDDLWACVWLIRDLEGRFPGAFQCPDDGYFSSILFTPWTTPEDLLANVLAARTLGWGWLRRGLGSRLQIRPGDPVEALARHDGLLVETWGDLGALTPWCLSTADDVEVPWRFADPRTATLFSVLARSEPMPWGVTWAPDDPLCRSIRERRRSLPAALQQQPLDLCELLVRAAARQGPDATWTDLFAEAVATHERQAEAASDFDDGD